MYIGLVGSSTKYDEIVYKQNTGVNKMEKSINNLLLIDQFQRDNMQQYERILECNKKLFVIENELSLKKNNFSVALDSILFNGTTNGNESLSSLNSNLSEMIHNVKKQLVDFFK